jgi:hypothetical protein
LAFLLAGFSVLFCSPLPSSTLSTSRFSPVSVLSAFLLVLAGLPEDLGFSFSDAASFLLAGFPADLGFSLELSFLLADLPVDFGFSLAPPFLLAGLPPLIVLRGS